MGLLEWIVAFGKPSELTFVYCQNCGRDITTEGGDVTSTGRIYCHGYKEDGVSRCLDHEMVLVFEGGASGILVTDYYDSKEVQKLLRAGKINNFGLLEQEARL
ncbi:MAG: hypothetical protein KKB79_02460 [Nanoarchaeota archaeon]|nr:hypothetical protein [Nanoarchaeota archaeon]